MAVGSFARRTQTPKIWFLQVGICLSLLLVSCAAHPRSALLENARRAGLASFTDSTFQTGYGYILYVQSESAFLIRYSYRDLAFNNPEWYYRSKVSTRLLSRLEDVRNQPASGIDRMQGVFGRTIYAADSTSLKIPEMFPREDRKCNKLFETVRMEIFNKKYLVHEIPDWVKSDPRIDKRFGLQPGAWDYETLKALASKKEQKP
ncbi:MAG: hypothetical protein JWM04_2770 [Verrucomicrobiales bacterium]|nr:hypothetical protein [Verrucomicrobiales bacterium]